MVIRLPRWSHGHVCEEELEVSVREVSAVGFEALMLATALLQRARLAHPDGFASYAPIQQWIHDTLGVSLKYDVVHNLVHDKLKARPKVPRLSHEKKTPTR